MNVQSAYDHWSSIYDSNENKTRDLEAIALRELLGEIGFDRCLECGCGTGKNTAFLVSKAREILALDLSTEMLARAQEKIKSEKVRFQWADLTADWGFVEKDYDLAVFSLVLEHIEDLNIIFQKLSAAIRSGGHVYIGELHPFKQYTGSKARFETQDGTTVVTCYNHHVSDFYNAAHQNGFSLVNLQEYFDDANKEGIPRVLALLFQKE